jgi:hypothetical protein
MYWCGYWTAVYHVCRLLFQFAPELNFFHQYQKRNHAENSPVQEDGEEPAEADEEDNVRDDVSMTHPR